MGYTSLISTSDLARHLDATDWVIVDCRFSLDDKERGVNHYRQAHIPGAVYTHLDDDLSATVVPDETGRHPLPSHEVMARRFGALGIGSGMQVVAYDDSGGAIAARLWWMLQYLGHDDAAVLDGGWNAWTAEGRPVSSGVEQMPARTFNARPRPHMVVEAEEVERIRRDPNWRLLDARDAARYRGEVEPIDPVAGHIPGAVSAPFKENLGDDGRFRPQEELRERFGRIIGAVPADRVVHHCGSGVTACHNLLAMRHAGLGDAKLYPGSWSEWIVDERRAVTQGSEKDEYNNV